MAEIHHIIDYQRLWIASQCECLMCGATCVSVFHESTPVCMECHQCGRMTLVPCIYSYESGMAAYFRRLAGGLTSWGKRAFMFLPRFFAKIKRGV